MENNQRSSSNPHLAKPVLCDGFLIPMTDFVLRINEIEKEVDQFFDSWRMKQLRIIENYAKFLKQPLKLEMFVPCDEGGNILENPDKHQQKYKDRLGDFYLEKYKDDYKSYKQAKEKIMFEGFRPYEDYECAKYEDVYIDEEVCDGKFTIEELIKDVGKAKIKLSQNALDSIFGKTGP